MPEETDGFVEVRENVWTRRDAAVKTQPRKGSGRERIGRDGHGKNDMERRKLIGRDESIMVARGQREGPGRKMRIEKGKGR